MFSEIFGRSDKPAEASMEWNVLTGIDQLDEAIQASNDQPVLIFKHSTRCGTSAMALDRLERRWNPDQVASLRPYYVDVIGNRDVSNEIAQRLEVWHQSPQVLLLHHGKAIYDNSHMGISYEAINEEYDKLLAG